jgi:hypothetical protein
LYIYIFKSFLCVNKVFWFYSYAITYV